MLGGEQTQQQFTIEYLPHTGLAEPPYLIDFLRNNTSLVQEVFGKTQTDQIDSHSFDRLLDMFSQQLPLGDSFRELAAALILRDDGNIDVVSVEGDRSQIDEKTVDDLLFALGNQARIDAQKILIVHTHPFHDSLFMQVVNSDFSEQDKSAFKHFGQRFAAIFPKLRTVGIGVCTAGPSRSKNVLGMKNTSWNYWEVNF